MILCACTSPSQNYEIYANQHQFSQDFIASEGFKLLTYNNNLAGKTLSIYLDGDGSPWLRGLLPALDPTPRNLLVLKLLQQDPSPAIYLARPCYFETGPADLCTPMLWTQSRYGPQVIAAMNTAVDQIIAKHQPQSVQLIGYSGGGSLAVLLASRRRDITSVITIAANLDTAHWTKHHGYLPLTDSINPADEKSLNLPSLHLSGGQDLKVPSATLNNYLKKHSGEAWYYPDFNHSCCWQKQWPQILSQAREHLSKQQ